MTLHRSRILSSTFSAKHSVNVHDSLVNAYENVQRFLADPSEQKLTPRVLEKMYGLYERYKGLDDSVLEEKLETSGVRIPGPDWYNKGRTLDEAVLLLIYTSRKSQQVVKIEAQEFHLKHLQAALRTAPDPQRRRELELQIEAIQAQLKDLRGAEPGRPPTIKTVTSTTDFDSGLERFE